MNFKDTWATNESGEKFIFTVEMQRRLYESGLPVEVESLGQEAIKKSQPKPQDNQGGSAASTAKHEDEPPVIDFEEPKSIQIDPETGKYIGRVKWYNVSKGYGFLSRGGKEDVFFHKTDVICDPNDLDQGVWILYDVEKTDKGLEASEVELYQQENS